MLVAGWSLRGLSQPAARPAFATPIPTPYPTSSAPLLLDEAWSKVRESFVGEVPTDTLRNYGAIRGAMGTLKDPYSIFIEPRSRSLERDQQSGAFGGIGATLAVNADGVIALTPIRGTPAERAGVHAGDLLLSVDGVPVPRNPDLNEVLLRIRGEVGVPVTLLLARGPEQLTFTITRAVIEIPSVDWRVITGTRESKAGLIVINSFTARTSREVRQAIGELRAAGASAWILDLRNNGGGLLGVSIEVASEFIPEGVILFERRNSGSDVSFRATGGGLVPTEPVMVLVNGNSASASEIVAGALQDHGRARLIGTKTYGKGSAQYVYDLSDGSSVHVTFAKWLTPNGRSIDGVGLMPDVEVKPDSGIDPITTAYGLLFPAGTP